MRDTLTLTLSAIPSTSTTLWAAPRSASRCSSRTSLKNCSREVTACVTTASLRTGSRDPALLFSCAILMKTPSMLERTIADVIGYLRQSLRRPLRRRPLRPSPLLASIRSTVFDGYLNYTGIAARILASGAMHNGATWLGGAGRWRDDARGPGAIGTGGTGRRGPPCPS